VPVNSKITLYHLFAINVVCPVIVPILEEDHAFPKLATKTLLVLIERLLTTAKAPLVGLAL